MVSVKGGGIHFGKWNSVGFSWNRVNGEASLFLNGRVISRKQTTYEDRDLFDTAFPDLQIGFKLDNNHHFFQGYIADLSIYAEVLSDEKIQRLFSLLRKFPHYCYV